MTVFRFKKRRPSLKQRSRATIKPETSRLPEKDETRKRRVRIIGRCVVILFLLTVYHITSEAVYIHEQPVYFPSDNTLPSDPNQNIETREYEPLVDKKEVRDLLDSQLFVNLKTKDFYFVSEEQRLHVETTIDPLLQNFIMEKMDTTTSRHIGIVAMDPYSGRVLSMVGFDREDPNNNPCVDSIFPAASVFKIVTAAAAIEKCGFESDTKVTYSGRKHTLYKSQLKKKTRRRLKSITLRDSFAQSINPVFGKIGIHELGKTALEEYADAFGFNQDIDFEIPLAPSVFSISDETYHWAEVASGFNRETTISPLHGALIASAILNQGQMIEPVIIDEVRDEKGDAVYQGDMVPFNRAITPDASDIMNELMQATIKSGTCRKMFRGYRRDPVLSKLTIGGKSGTISSKDRKSRYDWFVGFAEEKDGPEKIVTAIVVAHGKYIGIRSAKYARIVFKEYFSNYFSSQESELRSEN
ncbi:penicillin-binding transpeptidase domain-containing protein [Desulfobacterales bacterium HSG2]|nr:penicillin-binding transpeptidase domain-containing protein [Desulfobacterales bacterium HSG2]